MALFAKAGWDPNHYPFIFEHLESMSGGMNSPDRQALPSRADGRTTDSCALTTRPRTAAAANRANVLPAARVPLREVRRAPSGGPS